MSIQIPILKHFVSWVTDPKAWNAVFLALSLGILAISIAITIYFINGSGFVFNALIYISNILFVGTISGALLKIFSMEGYFLQSITDAITHPNYVRNLSTEKQRELWDFLSTHCYIPNITDHSDSHENKSDINKMLIDLRKGISKRLTYIHNYFVDSSEIRISFKKAKMNSNDIEISISSDVDMIIFDKNSNTELKSYIIPAIGLKMNSYKILKDDIFYNNNLYPNVRTEEIEKDEYKEKKITITSYEFFKLSRERRIILSPERDPSYRHIMPQMANKIKVTIENMCANMRLTFEPIGGDDAFLRRNGESFAVEHGDTATFENTRLLLPNEGYSIIMSQVVPAIATTQEPSTTADGEEE